MNKESLVEFVGHVLTPNEILMLKLRGYMIKSLPQKNKVYTVRDVRQCPGTKNAVIYVNEQIFGYNKYGEEMSYGQKDFRELNIPPDIEEEITEIANLELVEVNHA